MRTLLVIGIGTGDPDHVTMQAVKALNRVDAFLVIEKGNEKHDLVDLRREVCRRYATNKTYRWVEARDPARDRTTPEYSEAVDDWRRRRADVFEGLIRDELAEGECGGILVWGDPAVYDSTLAILDDIASRGALELEIEVIPGISSPQALAAGHRIGLNRVGRPFQITTGRLLAQGFPEEADDVVVMLDAECSFTALPEHVRSDLDIYWGAYVGSDDEILISGPVNEVADEIARRRSEARAEKGWVMDTYLLRRNRSR